VRFELLSRSGAELLKFCAVWREGEGGGAAEYGERGRSIKKTGEAMMTVMGKSRSFTKEFKKKGEKNDSERKNEK
jgi:hypothetical protein